MRNDRPTHPARPRTAVPRPSPSGVHEAPRVVERHALERIMAQRCAHMPASTPGGRISLGEELFVRLRIGSQG